MSHNKFYIISGIGATATDHWFPWLTNKINEDPAQTAITLNMPNPEKPELKAWLAQLADEIPKLDKNTYLIAHSLGCITTLHYLYQSFGQDTALQVGGLLLVSGFTTLTNVAPLDALPLLAGFVSPQINFAAIKQITQQNITVVSSADDYIVPTELTDQLAQNLAADYYRKAGTGHFLAQDGYTEFPLLLALLANLMQQNNLP